MEKPNHFWKWYIGRFWYFDVSKASGENNLAFQCCAKLVGLSPARLDPALNEPSDTPLSPTEHLKRIETYLYTPKYSHISPIRLQSCIRHKQASTDTGRQQEILFSMFDWVNLELNHHFGQTLKGKIFSPDTFETSKYQNLPMYHFQKCWGFAVFCEFNTCHKEITIDSLFGSPCRDTCVSKNALQCISLWQYVRSCDESSPEVGRTWKWSNGVKISEMGIV